MRIELREEPIAALADLADIPIAFEVRRVLDVSVRDQGLGGFILTERVVDAPYVKDYDAVEGEGPRRWAQRFDVSNWGLILAHVDGERAGAGVVAFDTPGVDMLEGRRDLAVLRDIRVVPRLRRQGVGTALLRAAEEWAQARGCRRLKIETQNINVPACRFYARHGCVLGAVHRYAYREYPNETQML